MTQKSHFLQRRLAVIDADQTAELGSALGDPLRVKMVALILAQKDLCLTDLSAVLGVSLPLVSHHLRILRQAGLVSVTRRGQMQCCAINQRLRRFLTISLLRGTGVR